MPEIFYRDALENVLYERCRRNSSYSLRAFAKALHISPGSLSLVMSGKRVPSAQLTRRMLDVLNLTPADRSSFLSSIAEAHSKRSMRRKSPFFKAFADLQKNYSDIKKVDLLAIDVFCIIADWHHYAIMMLLETESAKDDSRWIAKQLGVTPNEASMAMKRLIKLNLIKKKGSRWTIDSKYLTTADRSMTTPALRVHQRQVLEKAIHALEHDPIETRSISSLTMSIDPEKIPMAKEMIEDFSQKLCAFLEGGSRKQVYQLGISLFALQKGEKK